MAQSAYDILNMATNRQLTNLSQLRSDITEKRKVANAQSLGVGQEGGFYQDEINALEREYMQAKNDIMADANTQRQIIAEQERAEKEAARQRNIDRWIGIGTTVAGIVAPIAAPYAISGISSLFKKKPVVGGTV
jgi:hypothetical protein